MVNIRAASSSTFGGEISQMLPPVRRLVTGHDEDGCSIILSDGPAPAVSAPSSMPELVATVVWATPSSPPSNAGAEDMAPGGPVTPMAPGEGGSIFRIADFPPDSHYAAVDISKMFEEIGGREAHDSASDSVSRHFWFHRTPTLDYGIVLEGEIWALLEKGETLMRAGDVVVQRGTSHAWSNRGDRPCRMAFVLLDATD